MTLKPTLTFDAPFKDDHIFCDDDKQKTIWIDDVQKYQTCVWLQTRPEYQDKLCNVNHPSGAFHICEETCGKCLDNCIDTSKSFLYQGRVRDCLWLSLRPSIQKKVCEEVGNAAAFVCPETCDKCDGKGQEFRSPSLSRCDDSQFETFFVSSISQSQRCTWLAARPEFKATLCLSGDPSNARLICPETCGACQDACVDSSSKFTVEGDLRDCLWLSIRPHLHGELCSRSDIRIACQETCNECDT
jgi:hypothetical protein